jgi:hypothetical protein
MLAEARTDDTAGEGDPRAHVIEGGLVRDTISGDEGHDRILGERRT